MEGVHVAFRQADDRQPRPEFVIQFTQHRRDLEEKYQPDVDKDDRIPLRAGTTLIARINGLVDFIIAKPLPLKEPYAPDAELFHQAGTKRYQGMTEFFEDMDFEDPLSVWKDDVPAVKRLDFASMHDDMESGL
jgi:hypothetical protein